MNCLLSRLADNRDPDSWAAAQRRRRLSLFLDFIAPLKRPLTILDVGGTEGFWQAGGGSPEGSEVVLLNRTPADVTLPNFDMVVGDATDLRDFHDGEVDVVFSNSAIEHVGDLAAQRRMAEEVMRVGRHFFVQTPNKLFPLEPHYLFPCFQFLPVALRVALVRRFDLGWYGRIPDPEGARAHVLSHRLLTAGRLAALFPGARIVRERFWGVTKSLVACGGPGSRRIGADPAGPAGL